jgi:hypothetical protein
MQKSPVPNSKLELDGIINSSPVPSKYIEPVPYFTCEALTEAFPIVIKLFFRVLSKIPALAKLQSKET